MRLLRWAGENLPLVISFALALWTTIDGEFEPARFFIIMGVMFIILRELSEIKADTRALIKSEERKL